MSQTSQAQATKCSKPAGAYCRLHNLLPPSEALTQAHERIESLLAYREPVDTWAGRKREPRDITGVNIDPNFDVEKVDVPSYADGEILAYTPKFQDDGTIHYIVTAHQEDLTKINKPYTYVVPRGNSRSTITSLRNKILSDVETDSQNFTSDGIKNLKQHASFYKLTEMPTQDLLDFRDRSEQILEVQLKLSMTLRDKNPTSAAALVDSYNYVSKHYSEDNKSMQANKVMQILVHKYGFFTDKATFTQRAVQYYKIVAPQ